MVSCGFLKMLISAENDEILGFAAFGAEASELMVAVQTAILGKRPYTILRDAILTHPTIAEGLIGLLANAPAQAARQEIQESAQRSTSSVR